eukprot:scaffold139894_cov21-Prasinocladus_malaysianus.AAC.1
MQHFVHYFLPNLDLFGVSTDDLMVFNMGIWHRQEDSWSRQGRDELDEYRGHFDKQVKEFGDYYTKHKDNLPQMVWKDTITQHKNIDGAERLFTGDTSSRPYEISLDNEGHLYGEDSIKVNGGWRNGVTDEVMKGLGLPYVETWNQTAVLYYMHKVLRTSAFLMNHKINT